MIAVGLLHTTYTSVQDAQENEHSKMVNAASAPEMTTLQDADLLSRRTVLAALPAIAVALGGCAESDQVAAKQYENALATPKVPLRVFHLGHSLVGRDIPAMVGQLAGAGHAYESQLGWGTPLQQHWEPGATINGFATENAHPRYRDAREAIGSGDYDAVVLTEMVEIRDAIAYFDSADYLHRWTALAWTGRRDTRVYLYETWPRIDDPEGWVARVKADLSRHWENDILYPAMAYPAVDQPIYVVPGGQVLAGIAEEIAARGGVGGASGFADLFARTADGGIDTIHINDLGAYAIALTHYAVLYHDDPRGLPHQLQRADGSLATAPSADLAALMQAAVWTVVTSYPKTGLAQRAA